MKVKRIILHSSDFLRAISECTDRGINSLAYKDIKNYLNQKAHITIAIGDRVEVITEESITYK